MGQGKPGSWPEFAVHGDPKLVDSAGGVAPIVEEVEESVDPQAKGQAEHTYKRIMVNEKKC